MIIDFLYVQHTETIKTDSEFVVRYRNAEENGAKVSVITHEKFESMQLNNHKTSDVKQYVVTCPACRFKIQKTIQFVEVKKHSKVISTIRRNDSIVRVRLCLCCGSIWTAKEDFSGYVKIRELELEL